MPFPEFFSRFGIFSKRDFLPPDNCRALCDEMAAAVAQPGGMWNPHDGQHLREDVKKRKEVAVSPSTEATVHENLVGLMPILAEHFSVSLSDVQPSKFTRYDEGDYYRVHQDVTPNADLPDEIRDRKLAITIFLNQESDVETEGDYVGGNLTFYGLLGEDGWNSVGLPFESDAGMLVAFRPETIHEVTAVTHGTRFAITTWFI